MNQTTNGHYVKESSPVGYAGELNSGYSWTMSWRHLSEIIP